MERSVMNYGYHVRLEKLGQAKHFFIDTIGIPRKAINIVFEKARAPFLDNQSRTHRT